MSYAAPRRHRRSIRLNGYDYVQTGAYFVTLCTHDRLLFFENATTRKIAEECWLEIPEHFPAVELDEWVVMPNHLHGIIVRDNDTVRRGVQLNAPTTASRDPQNPFSIMSPRRNTFGLIIRTYKAAVTTQCRRANLDFGWQRNYYEHVIRDEVDLARIRQYIANNPAQWKLDENNPARRLEKSG
jgi:REP element-mobilizing transposase RayT